MNRVLTMFLPVSTLGILLAAAWLLRTDGEWVSIAIIGTWLATTALVGTLVATKDARNAVGWLMLVAAWVIALGLLAEAYASYVFELGHAGLPLGGLSAWLTLWLTIPGFVALLHLFLRFPTGRLPSPGWRWVSRAVTMGLIVNATAFGFRKGPVDNVRTVDNPLGVLDERLTTGLANLGQLLLVATALLSLASLVVRFRNAGRTERQQMKWFVLAVALFPVMFLLSMLSGAVDTSEDAWLAFLLNMTGLLFLPVSMGIGILRHRLYDIDIVVNRALVYGGLTALLAGAYLAIVVLLQRILDTITADSDLAIAASTLAVAALFRPLRSSVQSFIDRRFYRRKYDAAETLGAFSARLRDQVDLDALGHELVAVVGSTMQPAHASLWLRQGSVG